MNNFIMGTLTALTLFTFAAEATGQRANPVLATSDRPFGTIDFQSATPTDYEEAVMEGIATQNRLIDAIVKNPEAPTFENTIVALDRSSRQLNQAVLALSNLEHAMGDTLMMQVMERVSPILSEQTSDLILNEPLWNRIKSVYNSRNSSKDLNGEQLLLITET